MEEDKELFSMIHDHHRKCGTTRRIGYIVYDHQADRIRSVMDAQARQGDVLPLVVIALQVIVFVAVILAIIV